MRHNIAHRKLGRTTGHRLALFRNMLSALVTRDRIETTLAKAKELRPLADKLVTLAKKGTLCSRRTAFSLLRDDISVKKLFSTLVDRYRERKGGYTRIYKLGFRHGDSAPMAILEYLTAEIKKESSESKKTSKVKKAPAKKEKK
ncbi:MAG: 50S ribosomal protein L17 [Deltaproteobacteria bacterium CG11_big_fil_rev_8_21_14_0_20_49_13]|nr:MAG: 50S ribosomal protein L17 [Deltaproteobacteria bacterium CG11_big_fil_rev_8_21_14_0_20_49_13]